MKISAIHIYCDYHRIKKDVPSYRLGQHYCNVIGILDSVVNGMDLFFVETDILSDKLFYQLCANNQWDVLDLPIFGAYDITSIKPL